MKLMRWILGLTFISTMCLAEDSRRSTEGRSLVSWSASIIIEWAKEFLVQFTKEVTDRLFGEIFGTGRAARCTDIIILNTSKRRLRLRETSCTAGGFTDGLHPDPDIGQMKGSVYGIQSHGFMTGAGCTVQYDEVSVIGKPNGHYVRLTTNNPYIGINNEESKSSNGYKVVASVGKGTCNQVRYVIQEIKDNTYASGSKNSNVFYILLLTQFILFLCKLKSI